jgi:CRP-like cAMP-binding protein
MENELQRFKSYLMQVISMDDESFEIAREYLNVEKISKGDFLIQEGKICNKIAFIVEGLFRIYTLKDGTEVNTCFCLENSITTSFNSFVNQVPSVESIQALENSVLITLSYRNLTKLQHVSVMWQMIRQLITEKECIRLSDRASSLSFESAIVKYENLLKLQPEIVRRVSIQHIASYIGVSRETLSRIRSKK